MIADPPAAPIPEILGRPRAWSRDLAIVGGATACLTILAIDRFHWHSWFLVNAAVGALLSALFGAAFRRLLVAWLRLPLLVWVPISLLLGGIWGGAVGVVLELFMGGCPPGPVTCGPRWIQLALSGGYAAFAGALQLSWFWLPYAVRAGRGKSTWPVVAAAVVLAAPIGWAALYLLLEVWRPMID